ncbi:MAG: hypothetical protein PHT59_03850 [Candidatus Omnitrophica bacterium]|nr:hypothetical protein [Candidatus Omnitrophota bacterium]
MVDLIGDQIKAMEAGIRYKNPGINDAELEKCLRKRMLKVYSLKH